MAETSKHEVKDCPRCGSNFECKVGDIINCQCNGILFTEAALASIANYEDCLCRVCLDALNTGSQIRQQPCP